MSRRTSEPSERVAEILDESRDPRPLELPSTLAGGRYGVSRQAIVGVALVVAVAVAMLAGRTVLARQDAAPQPVTTSPAGAVAASGEPDGEPTTAPAGASATPGAAPTTAGVTVHVVGQVRRPGMVTLDAGARVADAIEEVGGATRRADLDGVNLARLLVDGEQVVVPKPGETPPAAGAPAGGAPSAGGAPAGTPAAGAPVNLNTADLATLETLPGVGPVLAQRILDWRTEHGSFTAVEELGEVSGIGDKIYAQLAPEVTV
ncbi:helix-hairpin-helix domain-containing protein [Janibacter sp. CX7]|uniref:helix-hairpin-helix domain-containing protein n=1 Tax=unclassified Janibacter TaxID=2649294 RepID=UPI0020CDF7DE|nr:helix-hairpin-helix domain-containing protein [Janibacter sp. CX7]UTT67188.1 helix-hairpin-helix domain-containing protein [Janibacter sp. CX7]